MPPQKPKTRKVLCPECDTEVERKVTESGDFEGNCDNCGLDVGNIYTKRRYRNADRKIDEREQEEQGNKGKGKKTPTDW